MMQKKDRLRLLMITELFLPTKGGTAVSFDDDFRRLGGKEVHVITAGVPGAVEFDRDHPNSIHRLVLKRREWLKPESLLIYTKFFVKSFWLTVTQRINTIYARRHRRGPWATGVRAGEAATTQRDEYSARFARMS